MTARLTTAAALTLALLTPAARAGERDEAWAIRQIGLIKESDTTDWQRIPWAASLLDAERAAKAENRPVFLFTHDGNLDTGRC